MITRSDIRQETNSITYSRGQQVWQNGKVHDLKVETDQTKNGRECDENYRAGGRKQRGVL